MIENHKTENVSKGSLEDIHENFHTSLLQYTSVESSLYVFPMKFLFAPQKNILTKHFCFNWHLLKPEHKAQQVFCCLLLGRCFGHQAFQALFEVGN